MEKSLHSDDEGGEEEQKQSVDESGYDVDNEDNDKKPRRRTFLTPEQRKKLKRYPREVTAESVGSCTDITRQSHKKKKVYS